MTVTFDDLLKEIERLDSQNPDGFTCHEMAKETGHSKQWCREKIRDMIEKGRLEFNGHRKQERSDKKIGYTPVYKIISQ